MQSMTCWITSNLEIFLFLGMNGTRSCSLDKYICISAFSPSRCLWTRPPDTAGTDAPVEHTAVIAFIFKYRTQHEHWLYRFEIASDTCQLIRARTRNEVCGAELRYLCGRWWGVNSRGGAAQATNRSAGCLRRLRRAVEPDFPTRQRRRPRAMLGDPEEGQYCVGRSDTCAL